MKKHLFRCWLCELWLPSDDPDQNSCHECFERGKRIYAGTEPGLIEVDNDDDIFSQGGSDGQYG